MREMLPLSQEDFGLFQKWLIETCGLHFDKERNQSLHLALWQRLQHRGVDSYREYYNLLKFHPEGRLEMQELLDLITIGETYFFRNKAQFNILMKFVLPEMVKRKESSRDKSIRIWSAGCSRGDEPYSIAMAIMEGMPSYGEWNLFILGTDINRNGLACAKEALYEEKDIRHLPRQYLEKYFDIQGSTYALHPDLKKMVKFEYHNLVRDSFFQEMLQNIDLIFCRNVTIYFDFETTRRVIENFYHCLAEEGYLFLGHTETLWQITDKFERIEFPQTFIYQKGRRLFREEAAKPFMAVPERKLEEFSSIRQDPTEQMFALRGLRSGSLEKYKSPEQVKTLSDQPVPPSSIPMVNRDKNQILTYLTKATILANEARYKEAMDILAKVIKMDNLSVEAHYLLGVLSYKSGDLKGAETQFRKVIYVTPDSVLAYFNLGNIYLYQKKFKDATREFKNVIRLSEKRPKDEQVRFCEDFTIDFLIRACKNNLSEISKRGERYE